MAEITIGGETFNVLAEGPESAPVLMLSNSLGTNLHMWDGQMAALTKHFRVVRYDSRGHGASVVTGGSYSIAGLGRDALAIMDGLNLDRVHWMGLSMGGMVGQWLLVNARERIGRAILANTSSRLPTPDMWNTRIRTVLSQGMHAITPTVLERWFTPAFLQNNPVAVERIADMLHTTPIHGYTGCCGAIRDMDQRESIRSISNPVLVIVGKHDPATSPEMGAEMAASIREAKLITLDAAHLSNIEMETQFNKAIVDFLMSPVGKFAPPRRESPKKAAAKKAMGTKAKAAAKKTSSAKAPKKAAKTVAKKSVKSARPPAKSAPAKSSASKSSARKPAGKIAKKPAKAASPRKPQKKPAAKRARR